jgi:hypothetical protein
LKHPIIKVGAKLTCSRPVVPGRARCKLHGGLATGPLSDAGVERSVAAMVAGRRAWLEQLKQEGRKATCGRIPKDAGRQQERADRLRVSQAASKHRRILRRAEQNRLKRAARAELQAAERRAEDARIERARRELEQAEAGRRAGSLSPALQLEAELKMRRAQAATIQKQIDQFFSSKL